MYRGIGRKELSKLARKKLNTAVTNERVNEGGEEEDQEMPGRVAAMSRIKERSISTAYIA